MTTQQPELFQILIKQHREVDGMLSKLAELEHAGARQSLFRVLEQQLMAHAKAEEKTFYAALARAGEKRDARHAKREHREVEEAIAKVQAVGFEDDSAWRSAIQNLTGTVQHHVEEEESEIFQTALDSMSTDELDAVAERFQAQRLVELEALGGIDDGYDELTKKELLEEASAHEIEGRSAMSKDELIAQLRTLQ
jgi:hemerythrin-like domain-containing protein